MPPSTPRLRWRAAVAAAALAIASVAALGAPVAAQDAQPGDATTTTTTPAPQATPEAPTAGPGTYGLPTWLPLRRGLDGGEVKVGCTFESHGSEHGYECGGHHGRWAIDFIAETGTPVFAAGAGFATDLTGRPGGSGFGNVVRVDHGFGISTVYAHLDTSLVPAEGTWVDASTQLGTVGSTGSSSTPHLHFERFALGSPTSVPGAADSESVDPGPLYACRGDLLVSFPQVAGFESWFGLAWGSLTVASDGSGCLDQTTSTSSEAPAGAAADAPAPSVDLPDPAVSGWWPGARWRAALGSLIPS